MVVKMASICFLHVRRNLFDVMDIHLIVMLFYWPGMVILTILLDIMENLKHISERM